jgi:hypothetical protein
MVRLLFDYNDRSAFAAVARRLRLAIRIVARRDASTPADPQARVNAETARMTAAGR